MSLPSIEPLPSETESLPPARRRRQRRMIIPPGSDERADFLIELARRTVPSFDFFLFSLLAGVTLGLAFLLDSPALVLLTVLLAPFMAPAIGISLGTITGMVRFVAMSLGSLSIGSLIVFLCGAVAGWAVNLLPGDSYTQAIFHSRFSWPYFAVLGIGAMLTNYLIVRSPNQKPLVTSVAVTYALYVPAGAAGFGISSGISGLWPQGVWLFLVHLVWIAAIGTLMLAFLGVRPLKTAGYILASAYFLVGLVAITPYLLPAPAVSPTSISQPPALSQKTAPGSRSEPSATASATVSPAAVSMVTPTPFSVVTPSPTTTRTLIPSPTWTMTISPVPTPVWARISASEGNGAIIRKDPNYEGAVIQALLNGTLVEVLPDQVINNGSVTWVRVRTVDGKEGWIVRALLRTATPAPGW